MKSIWSIAGLDSSAGAGILADAQTARAWGIHCCGVPTCVTVQDGVRVTEVQPLPRDTVERITDALASNFFPTVIKVGVLPSVETVEAVVAIAKRFSAPLVLDPVLKCSGGHSFGTESVRRALVEKLLPWVHTVTPNWEEALILTGQPPSASSPSAEELVSKLHGLGAKRVWLKGGHRPQGDDGTVVDVISDGVAQYALVSPRLATSVHGSGCFASTALVCALAKGEHWYNAVLRARQFAQTMHHEAVSFGEATLASFAAGNSWLGECRHFPEVNQVGKLYAKDRGCPQESDLGVYPIAPDSLWVERLAKAGADTIQLRFKCDDDRAIDTEVRLACELSQRYGCRLYINDHWQAAMRHGAYGVHLGQEDLLGADVQAIHQSGLRLGISTHDDFELRHALACKPSYIAFGPIFATTCKSMAFGPQGIERLRAWCQAAGDIPVVAIGGLRLEHLADVAAAGAQGAAVIQDILGNPHPEKRLHQWQQCWSSLPLVSATS